MRAGCTCSNNLKLRDRFAAVKEGDTIRVRGKIFPYQSGDTVDIQNAELQK